MGIYPEKKKKENSNLKGYMHTSFHSSSIYNSQDMEATQVPIKATRLRIYAYNGILLSQKKDEILTFAATWMDLENVTFSQIN